MSKRPLKEGEIVELKILGTSRDGRAIARMKGSVIFVKDAKLGQTVRSLGGEPGTRKRKLWIRRYLVAVERIETLSPSRRESRLLA